MYNFSFIESKEFNKRKKIDLVPNLFLFNTITVLEKKEKNFFIFFDYFI